MTRTYTARVVDADPRLLWAHHVAMCRGKAVLVDYLATARAALAAAPEPADHAMRVLHRRLVAALWLPVESATDVPEQVLVQDVAAALRAELAAAGLSPDQMDSWLVDCAPVLAMRARSVGAVRVNRRAMARWAAEQGGFPLEELWADVELLVAGRPWTKVLSSDADPPELNTVARNWVSRRLGSGRGADFDLVAKAYAVIADVAEGPCLAGELLDELAGRLGVEPTAAEVLAQVSTSGPPKRARRLLAQLLARNPRVGISGEEIADLRAAAAQAAGEAAGAVGAKGPRPWTVGLVEAVMRAGGPELTARVGQEGYCELMFDAARSMAANTTWVRRQLTTLADLAQQITDHHQAAGADLVEAVDGWRTARARATAATEPMVAFGANTIRGVGDMVATFVEHADPGQRIVALRQVQADSDDLLGDPAFYTWLAGDGAPLWAGRTVRDTVERIGHYVRAETARRRRNRLALPQLTHPHPTRSPHWCEFGTTNTTRYTVTDPAIGRVEFTVWDGRAWRRTPARITSSRLANDLPTATNPDGVAVARADRIARTHAALQVGGRPVPVRAADLLRVTRDTAPRLRLYTDRRRWRRATRQGGPAGWHVALAVRLSPTARGPAAVARQRLGRHLRPGTRILGADLGLRVAAATACWQVVDRAEVDAVARSHNESLDVAATSLVVPWTDPHRPSPLGDGRGIYRAIEGHHGTLWARLDATVLIDDPAGGAGPSAEQLQRHRIIAGRALGRVGANTDTTARATSHARLVREYLQVLRRAVTVHARLATIAVRVPQANTVEDMGRLLEQWWAVAARARRSGLAQAWRCHAQPLLPPADGGGELLPWWAGGGPAELPHPTTGQIRGAAEHLAADPAGRAQLAAHLIETWQRADGELRLALRVGRLLTAGGRPSPHLLDWLGVRSGTGRIPLWLQPPRAGLGPRRLELLDTTYRLQITYWTRPQPEPPTPQPGIQVEQAPDGTYHHTRGDHQHERLKAKRDRFRDQLSKQVASAIVRTAVDQRCDVIALEDLDSYRTSLHRTRADNARLRRWSHQAVDTHVRHLAEVHGLAYRAVNPHGTSQRDAATGQPGPRVTTAEINHRAGEDTLPPWWRNLLTRARRDPTTPLHAAALATADAIDSTDLRSHRYVVLPRAGGPWFAATYPVGGRLLHPTNTGELPLPDADVNAAANIAHRALGHRPRPATETPC